MNEFLRVPQHFYEDPLSRIWTACAEAVGFRIVRSADLYASSDGRGAILLGVDEILDPDDCLAQMILHELCHALVEGEAGESKPDWGLDNTSGRDTWREHACLRLQAYLTAAWGLREFFAPTTDFRVKFWGQLSDDPFVTEDFNGRQERSCVAARIGAWRASFPNWESNLSRAFAATAQVVSAAASLPVGGNQRASEGDSLKSLYEVAREIPPRHPAGHSPVAQWHTNEKCSTCAWSFKRRGRTHCRHAPNVAFGIDAGACLRWEPAAELECSNCGACCREAYDSVELSPGERFVRKHPEFVTTGDGSLLKATREGGRCAALDVGFDVEETFRCKVYADRPRTCREFERGSENCLGARRKLGLSL